MSSPHRKALILLVKIFVITTILLLRSAITFDSNSVATPQSASVAQHSLPLPPRITFGSNILAAKQQNLNVTRREYSLQPPVLQGDYDELIGWHRSAYVPKRSSRSGTKKFYASAASVLVPTALSPSPSQPSPSKPSRHHPHIEFSRTPNEVDSRSSRGSGTTA